MSLGRFLKLWLGISSALTALVFTLFLFVEDDADDADHRIPAYKIVLRVFVGLLQTFALYEICVWLFDKLGIKSKRLPVTTLVAATAGGAVASLELNGLDYHEDDTVPDAGKIAAIFVLTLGLYNWLRGRK